MHNNNISSSSSSTLLIEILLWTRIRCWRFNWDWITIESGLGCTRERYNPDYSGQVNTAPHHGPHLSLRSKHNPELADNLNEGHLCLQQGKSHSNTVSWTVPKGHVGTRMTLGLLFRSEPECQNKGSGIWHWLLFYRIKWQTTVWKKSVNSQSL